MIHDLDSTLVEQISTKINVNMKEFTYERGGGVIESSGIYRLSVEISTVAKFLISFRIENG